MNEPQVDFSAIRGDWPFHMGFLTNGMTQTLKRAAKFWDSVRLDLSDDSVGQLVGKQTEMWTELMRDAEGRDVLDIDSQLFQDFIDVCRSTKDPCDALEVAQGVGGSSSIYDNTLEQFTEACRQARGLCDDLEMMREQRPDS
jgi:hypothetical protein